MKTYFLSLIFALSLNLVVAQQAQQRPSGKFISNRTDKTQTFEFNTDSFKYTSNQDMENKIGAGKFEIKNNNIYFYYKKIQSRDSSIYVIKKNKKGIKGLAHIRIFFDIDKQPAKHTFITIRDEHMNWVNTNYTDSLGHYDLYLKSYPGRYYLEILWIGYASIIIPIKDLNKFETRITGLIKPQQEYYVGPHEEVYQFTILSDTSFKIKNDKVDLIFKKYK